ncbi:hypothetical protein RJZ56_006062 [Blastomyces dermatitidis]|uniref:Basic proline-rich protein n=1 Tax=Blastomyces gilchristii (strain SLH14081) TaxID=559298 RepID=A0A179UWW9_BLAGS|nr:uncharacterized protein BDBG_07158 [Blastomyces gilchristii SLH14081]OAT11719.1 hypothetical protein BDBG_07158 [Blastomyces gilchristii SLH14081]
MRATTYSILAAFFSLAPLCETANAGAQGRPKYYFPREANRYYGFAAPAEKRAPQVDPGPTVVIIPVTVYVGPDGERYTLGGHTSTTTVDTSFPNASATPKGEDPEDNPSSSPLGGIDLGLPKLFAPPSASISGTEGVSFHKGGATGFPAQTPSPSPSSSSSSKQGLLEGFPTLELPGLGTPTPPIGGTGRTTTSDSSKGTQTASETESEPTDGPILTLPPLFPSPSSSSSSDSATDSTSSGTRSDLTDLTPLPSSSSDLPTFNLPTLNLPSITIPPIFTPTPSPSASMPVTSAPGNTTDGGITFPPFPTPTVLPPKSTDPIPSQNSSSTFVIPTPSTTPSGVFPNPTDRPTGWVPPKNSTTVTPTTTSSATQTPPPPPPSSSSKETKKPISTDSLTSMVIPTSIVFQPTPVPPNPSETNKPSSLPRIISPDSGIPKAPANSRLIQIGFNSSLPYGLVVSNRDSNVQVFSYVPIGVSYGLQVAADLVIMQSIQPYGALHTLQYTATLAVMYIPKHLVDELSVAIHSPYSLIYQNSNPSVAKLMSMIDPSIPLLPGGGPIYQENNPGNGGSGGSIGRPGGGRGGSEGGDDETEGPGGSGSSSSVKATSVGIGLGVVGGAALYGAAMFFVARRYRKRRKLHRRTSSLTSGMRQIGIAGAAGGAAGPIATDALMSGGRSDGYTSPTPYGARDSQSTSSGSGSGRNQMISAPVMAENSLGWN